MASALRSHSPHNDRDEKIACATPGCWEAAKVTGFCHACYQGWRRLRDLTMPELKTYFQRTQRLNARAAGSMNLARKTNRPKHLKQVV